MRFRYILILLSLLISTVVSAAVPEICGDGIDNASSGFTFGSCPSGWQNAVLQGSGCDRKCSAPDVDNDGVYTTGQGPNSGIDADDNDRRVIPGYPHPLTTGCSANQFKMVNADGTIGSCQNLSTYNPSTGSGATYWFSGTGSNTTGNGTYANPWRDYACFTDATAGCYHAPVAGDAYVFLTGTYSNAIGANYFFTSADGTAPARIKIIGAPGHAAVFRGLVDNASEKTAMVFDGANYWDISDITIQQSSRFGVKVQNSSKQIHFKRVTIETVSGSSGTQSAGLLVSASEGVSFTHGVIRDVYNTGIANGVSLVKILQAKDVFIMDNVMYQPTKDGTNRDGPGITWAQGSGAETGEQKLLRNVIYNVSKRAVEISNKNTVVQFNYVANSGTGVYIGLVDSSGSQSQDLVTVDRNTFYDVDKVLEQVYCTGGVCDATSGQFRFINNIGVANVNGTFSTGFVDISPSGPSLINTDYKNNRQADIYNNCYYNRGNAPLLYEWFKNGMPTFGVSTTTFANWQNIYLKTPQTSPLLDSMSYSGTDPAFDANNRATASQCKDKGWKQLPSASFAVSEEVCGNGIDDDADMYGQELSCPAGYVPAKLGGGCDALCPHPDEDNDGYKEIGACLDPNEKCDCDPTDKFIYPGQITTKGCSNGQVHTCQDNGQYTQCAAWSCPAGKNCKYFDSIRGSNYTGTGAIDNPWKDISKVSYWYYTNTPPFSLVTPAANDYYVMRNGPIGEYYNIGYDTSQIFMCRNNLAGSLASPITFTSYPGENPTFMPIIGTAINNEGCPGFKIENLKIDNFGGNGIKMFATDYIQVRNNIISARDVLGDNHAAIDTHSSQQPWLENNIMYNVFKPANFYYGNYNAECVEDFRSRDIRWWHNTCVQYPSSDRGSVTAHGFKQKHANFNSSLHAKGNVIIGPVDDAFQIAGGNVLIERNYIRKTLSAITSNDPGGNTAQVGYWNVINNTIIDAKTLMNIGPTRQWNYDNTAAASECTGDLGPGGFATYKIAENIYKSNATSYDGDNSIFTIGTYKADSLYTDFIGGGKFKPRDNIIYNSVGTALRFGIFESNNGDTSCGGRGNLGQSYTWSQWQAAGYDSAPVSTALPGSVNADPGISAPLFKPTLPGHQNKGWLPAHEEFEEPTLNEICGNGYSDTSTTRAMVKGSCPAGYMDAVYSNAGCDAICDDNKVDADADGFTTDGSMRGFDCNDNDRSMYPGQWTKSGCSSNQKRKCQTDGTYTSCQADPICEGTACYYVDTDTGLDTNACSYAAPCLSLQPFTASGGNLNVGTNAFVYVKGSKPITNFTTRTPDVNDSTTSVVLEWTRNGSAGNPNTLSCYPGEKCVIKPMYTSVENPEYIKLGTYQDIKNFYIIGEHGYSAPAIKAGGNNKITGNVIHNIFGSSYNGIAGTFSNASDITVANNSIYNIGDKYRNSNFDCFGIGIDSACSVYSDRSNTSNILFYGDTTLNYGVLNNVLFNQNAVETAPYSLSTATGIRLKQGQQNASQSAVQSVKIEGNMLFSTGGIEEFGSKTVTKGNLLYKTGNCFRWASNAATPGCILDNVFEYNTCIPGGTGSGVGSGYSYNPECSGATTGKLYVRNNIFDDSTHSIYTVKDGSLMTMHRGGSDGAYTTYWTGGALETQNNCYFNTNVTDLANAFCIFCSDPMTSGFQDNFTTWQGRSQDTGSFNLQPNLTNFSFVPQASNCVGKGWRGYLNNIGGGGGGGVQDPNAGRSFNWVARKGSRKTRR